MSLQSPDPAYCQPWQKAKFHEYVVHRPLACRSINEFRDREGTNPPSYPGGPVFKPRPKILLSGDFLAASLSPKQMIITLKLSSTSFPILHFPTDQH